MQTMIRLKLSAAVGSFCSLYRCHVVRTSGGGFRERQFRFSDGPACIPGQFFGNTVLSIRTVDEGRKRAGKGGSELSELCSVPPDPDSDLGRGVRRKIYIRLRCDRNPRYYISETARCGSRQRNGVYRGFFCSERHYLIIETCHMPHHMS